uniref:Apyrase n=1 Tax=Angiostrongylus cantonensis TaxID=6313 RepID=A0A0K0D4N1_ANGCA
LFTEAGLLDFITSIFGLTNRPSVDENDWLYPEPDCDNEVINTVFIFDTLRNGTKVYNMLAVTDMDKDAKSGKDWTWRAVTRRGKHVNAKGRAMELSDLSEFNGRLISPDDKTGLLYEIKDNKAIPWLFLNSGPGNATHGMKAEWTTIKGKYLYVGGNGTYLIKAPTRLLGLFQEYRDKNGTVLNEDAMWIKIVSKRGEVRSIDWKDVYERVRGAVDITAPGYLTHEAVQWSPQHRKWFFLPRKESKTSYNEMEDERKGTNLLIIGNPLLTKFKVVRVGNLTHPERGFSAFEFIPGTKDRLIVALKSEEVYNQPTASYITVFNINGSVILDDQKLDQQYKFEGIYFI